MAASGSIFSLTRSFHWGYPYIFKEVSIALGFHIIPKCPLVSNLILLIPSLCPALPHLIFPVHISTQLQSIHKKTILFFFPGEQCLLLPDLSSLPDFSGSVDYSVIIFHLKANTQL